MNTAANETNVMDNIEFVRRSWESRCPDWEIVRIYRAFEGDLRIIVRRTNEDEQRWTVSFHRLADGKVHCGFSRK